MSMDELLLQELYGSQQAQADEQVKQAQIELVEAVAAEAGVDLNQLDDEELSKFAHYVLSDEDEMVNIADSELETKLAEADLVGRQMALSYKDELNTLENGDAMFDKVAHALNDVADVWEMEKVALSRQDQARMRLDPTYTPGYRNSKSGQQLAEYYRRLEAESKRDARFGRTTVARHYADLQSKHPNIPRPEDVGGLGHRIGRMSTGAKIGLGLGGAALAGGLGYGGYRMLKGRQEEKKAEFMSMYDAADFAKEAELRAAEILLANGIDPQTLEDVQPEFAKLASFPDPAYARDDDEFVTFSEMNDMLDAAAQHIIDSLLD